MNAAVIKSIWDENVTWEDKEHTKWKCRHCGEVFGGKLVRAVAHVTGKRTKEVNREFSINL
jgi:hypothetical protein